MTIELHMLVHLVAPEAKAELLLLPWLKKQVPDAWSWELQFQAARALQWSTRKDFFSALCTRLRQLGAF
jgi:hypothetical protein